VTDIDLLAVRAGMKRARNVDRDAEEDPTLGDAEVGVTRKPCIHTVVRPELVFARNVMLLDRDYRARHAAHLPPIPTPTVLTARFVADAVYAGHGNLSIAAGGARVYTDAGCTTLLLDPDDGLPLTGPHPVRIPNAQLAGAGVTLYVLGGARGALGLRLALDPAAGLVVQGPAPANATVVELTLEASTFRPSSVALVEGQKIAFGKLAGVPPALARSLRCPVTIRQSTPQVPGARLMLRSSAPGVSVHPRERASAVGDADRLGAAQPDADQVLWVQGTAAGAPVWLSLGLELADGTDLDHGDLLKVIPVAQGAVSVGFEWEVNALMVERHHDLDRLRLDTNWEGIPSKGIVFQSTVAALRIEAELPQGRIAESYGEFVLGPAYDHAQLEGQFAELKRVHRAVEVQRLAYVRTPAAIMSREPGRHAEVWMPTGHRVALRLKGTWGGTAQASFAVPLWMLPNFLARFDEGPGDRAKQHAETFAAQVANDLGVHAGREATDLLIGLVAACQYYVEVFRGHPRLGDDDGPKTSLHVMFRTDFHAMYGRLENDRQRSAFAAWCAAHPHRADRLLPAGYSTGGGGFEARGPTIANWLASVIAPGGARHGKDLMSPPAGFPDHHGPEVIKYGMGKLECDGVTGNVIAECRDIPRNVAGFDIFVGAAFGIADDFLLAGNRTWVDHGLEARWGPNPLPVERRFRGLRGDPLGNQP